MPKASTAPTTMRIIFSGLFDCGGAPIGAGCEYAGITPDSGDTAPHLEQNLDPASRLAPQELQNAIPTSQSRRRSISQNLHHRDTEAQRKPFWGKSREKKRRITVKRRFLLIEVFSVLCVIPFKTNKCRISEPVNLQLTGRMA